MDDKATWLAIGVVIAVVAGCIWWLVAAAPDDVSIEAARQPTQPVPRINLKLLDGSLTAGKTVNGTLPIPVNLDALGRDDPFAGV